MTDAQLTTAIGNIADNTPNTALEMRNILFELMSRQVKPRTVIMRHVTNAYIVANFDITGLGINEEVGYAICNGNNTTQDWGGRVPIGFDSLELANMGHTFGTPNAVLVLHEHTTTLLQSNGENSFSTTQPLYSNSEGGDEAQLVTSNSSTEGQDGTNMNYQPSIVTLFVMKL